MVVFVDEDMVCLDKCRHVNGSVILAKLSTKTAPEFFIFTSSGAVSDENLAKMTTFSFQRGNRCGLAIVLSYRFKLDLHSVEYPLKQDIWFWNWSGIEPQLPVSAHDSCHDANFVTTVGQAVCQNDSLWCCHTTDNGWHHDNSSIFGAVLCCDPLFRYLYML